MKRLVIVLVFVCLGYFSLAQNKEIQYSFFVAGHTYGSPYNPGYGLYSPFVDKIDYINDYETMEFGCLTGDVVISSTAAYWDSAIVDINTFDMPIYIAAGNHDIGPEFTQRFGDYYYSFVMQNDLFITLTPYLNNWNIIGDQKDFLITTLDTYANDVDNIFVFLHELIWWSPDSIFQNVIINYVPYYPGSTNFWSEIEPLFNVLENEVVFFAGDLGCSTEATPYMYYNYENITLIGSGMGGGIEDNFIIIDVYDETVDYNLIAINGDDMFALGELTDFTLSGFKDDQFENYFNIYPNPLKDYFTIDCLIPDDYIFQIFDFSGSMIIEKNNCSKKTSVNVQSLSNGTYFLKIRTSNQGVITKKFLKI